MSKAANEVFGHIVGWPYDSTTRYTVFFSIIWTLFILDLFYSVKILDLIKFFWLFTHILVIDATRNFAYLISGPFWHYMTTYHRDITFVNCIGNITHRCLNKMAVIKETIFSIEFWIFYSVAILDLIKFFWLFTYTLAIEYFIGIVSWFTLHWKFPMVWQLIYKLWKLCVLYTG